MPSQPQAYMLPKHPKHAHGHPISTHLDGCGVPSITQGCLENPHPVVAVPGARGMRVDNPCIVLSHTHLGGCRGAQQGAVWDPL